VKMKIGGRMQNNADSLPGRTEHLIELARTTWGPDITLYMDANSSYDHTKAIEIGRLMEEYDYAL
jgi:D-galactarolactone cycloisomerase